MFFNWDLLKQTERDFVENCMSPHTVQVIQEIWTGAAADDPYGVPTSFSSGVYTVPGTWEYAVFAKERRMVGGVAPDGDGYFETDSSWKSTFEKDKSYVLYDSKEYIVDEIVGSSVSDGIIVKLKRK